MDQIAMWRSNCIQNGMSLKAILTRARV